MFFFGLVNLRFKPILFCILCITLVFSVVAEGAFNPLYFSTINVDVPTISELVRVRAFGWDPVSGDPSFVTGDLVSFEEKGKQCSGTKPVLPNAFTITYNVSSAVASADVVVRRDVFVVGKEYLGCYWSLSQQASFPMTFNSSGVRFVILGSMYISATISPAELYAGDGPVKVNITESNQTSEGRPFNQGKMYAEPFLLQCDEPKCADDDALVLECASTHPTVKALRVVGYTTPLLQLTFNIPRNERGTHALCVPYCPYTEGCSGPSNLLSWAVVTKTTINIQTANPTHYSVVPLQLQARDEGVINFHGSGLVKGDRVMLLREGSSCNTPHAPLMKDVILFSNNVDIVNNTASRARVLLPTLPHNAVVGQVCYARASAKDVWADIFKTENGTSADLIIYPMQPSSFKVLTAIPRLDSPVSIEFVGTGLNSTNDAARLAYNPSYSDCSVSKAGSSCTSDTSTFFNCNLRADKSGHLLCTTVIALPYVNTVVSLCACYKKTFSSNFAAVNGSISVAARDPLYVATPYPLFGGQESTLVFTSSTKLLTPEDIVKAVAPRADCATAQALPDVSFSKLTFISDSQTQINITGANDVCMDVCYRMNNSWTTSRSQSPINVSKTCSSEFLYIGTLDLKYTLADVTPATWASAQVELSGSLVQSISTLSLLANVSEGCSFRICDSIAPCSHAQLKNDYIDITPVLMATTETTYLICANVGVGSLVPIQKSDGSYVFSTSARNPSTLKFTSNLRVRQQGGDIRFIGSNLSTNEDRGRVITSESLLGGRACPAFDAAVSTILNLNLNSTASTPTTTVFAIGDTSSAVSNVSFAVCYYKALNGALEPRFAGHIQLLDPNPASFHLIPLNVRAGDGLEILFTAGNHAELSPSSDSIFFYQFHGLIPNGCRCTNISCDGQKRQSAQGYLNGNSTRVIFKDPLGFNNFMSPITFTLCYHHGRSGLVSYEGALQVLPADPSFFTTDSLAGNVGRPVEVTIIVLCNSCPLPSAKDDLVITLDKKQCVNITGLDPSQVEPLTALRVLSPRSAQRAFVPLIEGKFRVCYRRHNTSQFSELTFSENNKRALLSIANADPGGFTPVPPHPTSGQYLTVNISNCSSACATCTEMRLVPGEQASCWNSSDAGYKSTSCIGTPTLLGFPDVIIPPGKFIACYGAISYPARQIPGTLNMGPPNPDVFSAPGGNNVYTNQASNFTLVIEGEGLSTDDSVFLLPKTEAYMCHDLRNPYIDIRTNSTLSAWFLPTTFPYPLEVSADGRRATWVVSNGQKRFHSELITSGDARLCSNPGSHCNMQLCYLRAGPSSAANAWAPVPPTGSNAVVVQPANPTTVTFNIIPPYRVTQYAVVTAKGVNLTDSGRIFFTDGDCSTAATVANMTSASEINPSRDTMRAVVRFMARNQYLVKTCYEVGSSISEVPQGPYILPWAIETGLWYLRGVPGAARAFARYEYTNLSIIPSKNSKEPLHDVQSLTLSKAECMCSAFPNATYPVLEKFVKVSSSNFVMRLLFSGELVLCAQTKAQKVYRITDTVDTPRVGGVFVAAPADPEKFITIPPPALIMVNAPLNLTITAHMPQSCFPDGTCETLLGPSDTLDFIDGSLFDCGLSNATKVANFSLSFLAVNSTSATLQDLFFNVSAGTKLTVCYYRNGIRGAAVPSRGLLDRNLVLGALFPQRYVAVPPSPAQLKQATITFFSDSFGELSDKDSAKLVLSTPGVDKPHPKDCSRPAVVESASLSLLSNSSTVWNVLIPIAGELVVCYRRSGGVYAYVPLPGFLHISQNEQYTVFPAQPEMGQLANITLTGSKLSSQDRAKIVVTSGPLAAACTAETPNSDGQYPAPEGVLVTLLSAQEAFYAARVNFTATTVVLCYKRSGGLWQYIERLTSFSVGPLSPSRAELEVSEAYVTQRIRLNFIAEPKLPLSAEDEIRFVKRGSGINGFDCLPNLPNSSTLTKARRDAVNSSHALYRVCSSSLQPVEGSFSARWTVCYKRAGGTFAEIPLSTPQITDAHYGAFELRILPWGAVGPYDARLFELFALNYNKTPSSSFKGQVVDEFMITGSGTRVCQMEDYTTLKVFVKPTVDTNNDAQLALDGTPPQQGTISFPLLRLSVSKEDPLLMINTQLKLQGCDPCTFSPSFAFPGIERVLTVEGKQLTTGDTLKIILFSFGIEGCTDPKALSTGTFANKTFTPSPNSTSTATYFNIPVPTGATPNSFLLCYTLESSGKIAAIGSAAYGAEQFRIIKWSPLKVKRCPPEELRFSQRFTLNFSFPTVPGPLGRQDGLFVAPVEAGGSCSNARHAATNGTFVNASTDGTWSIFDIQLPKNKTYSAAAGIPYRVCYELHNAGSPREVEVANVGRQNLVAFNATPVSPDVNSTGFVLHIFGDALTAKDNIYIINASDPTVNCEEVCRTAPITPHTFNNSNKGFKYTIDTSKIPSLVSLNVTSPVYASVDIGVCYRVEGYNLARMNDIVRVIYRMNPTSWKSNLPTVVNSIVNITFSGTNLSSTDSAQLVERTARCEDDTNIIVKGKFISYTSDASLFSFELNKTKSGQRYKVCYKVTNIVVYSDVTPELAALPDRVTDAHLLAPAVAEIPITVEIFGYGLLYTDKCFAARLPTRTPTPDHLPADVCTDAQKYSQVNCKNLTTPLPRSTQVNRSFTTSNAGDYGFCYLTHTDTKPISVLGPFTVSSVVTNVTVETNYPTVYAPIDLVFTGVSLQRADSAGLALRKEKLPPTAEDCEKATLSNVSVVYDSDKKANVSASVTRAGEYFPCYKMRYGGFKPFPDLVVKVAPPLVESLKYKVQPGQCALAEKCVLQPVVEMLDALGKPTIDSSATVGEHLFTDSGGQVDPVIEGPVLVELTERNTTFAYRNLTLLAQGRYALETVVTSTRGGIRRVITTRSAIFEVEGGTSYLKLNCEPENHTIVRTAQPGESDILACAVLSKATGGPQVFDISVTKDAAHLTSIRHEEPTPADKAKGFKQRFGFNASQPFKMVNSFDLSVTPEAPFRSVSVFSSPLRALLLTTPSTESILTCSAPSGSPPPMNGSLVIRVGGDADCVIQGRVNGVDVLTLGDDYILTNALDGNHSSVEIPLPRIGVLPKGYLYANVPIRQAETVTVHARLHDEKSRPEISGSPLRVLVSSTPDRAVLRCVSETTGSLSLFSPDTVAQCTVRPERQQEPALVDSFDLTVGTGSGAVVTKSLPPSAYESSYSFAIQTLPEPVSKVFQTGFEVQTTFKPSAAIIGSAHYELIYVTKRTQPSGRPGNVTHVMLTGVGLSATRNTYRLASDPAQCTVQGPLANASAGEKEDELILKLLVPYWEPFFVCYTVNDSVTGAYGPLTPLPFSTRREHSRTLSETALILLIVGLILLLLLFLIFILCILMARRRRMALRRRDPVRTNDQYVIHNLDDYTAGFGTMRSDTSFEPRENAAGIPGSVLPNEDQPVNYERDEWSVNYNR